jgi:hypothetical protein
MLSRPLPRLLPSGTGIRAARRWPGRASANQCDLLPALGPALEGGAKVGANVHSYQATLGDVQPELREVNAISGDARLRLATGWS